MKIRYIILYALTALMSLAGDLRVEVDALIAYVSGLDGAVFIRNSSEHKPDVAAAHIRMKWNKLEKKITTAEDFISLCASKSSVSGQRYLVRMQDGKEFYCDDLLIERLKLIRASEKPSKSDADKNP